MDNKTKRKLEIIKASIDLMYLKGYNGTSVKDITDAAGIPKGSFYNYFIDKENYAVEAIRYYYNINSETKFALLRDTKLPPKKRITEFFKESARLLEKHGLKYGCFVGNLSQEMGDVNEAIAEATSSFYQKVDAIITTNLQEAKADGSIETQMELSTLGSFIISAWQGTLLKMKVARDEVALNEFLVIVEKELLR